jgi:hypothetical protein
MPHIPHELVVRLRTEGVRSVVLSIPAVIRQELCLKAGDLVVCQVEGGALVARKVELRNVAARLSRPPDEPGAGEGGAA